MKNNAQKDWLRWTLGGVVTGGVNYGLFHNSPEIVVFAVPVAVLIGAFWCINPERFVPSMVQVGIASLMLIFTHHATTKLLMKDNQWWELAAAGLFLGILGGVSVGALLGGVCRHFGEKNIDTRWKCNLCDEWHTELPFAYGPNFPDLYWDIPQGARDSRVEINRDFCIIDGKHFFVRGRLEIPVIDSDEVFVWNVWVSQSEKNFYRTIELIDTKGRESEPPYFGWLSNNLHLYPDTSNLKTQVHTQPVGFAPTIELEYSEHPLALEQRNGITLARVKEIAVLILHPDSTHNTNTEQDGGRQPATLPESK